MFEKQAEEWVKNAFPNDEYKQGGIASALVEFAELGYSKAKMAENEMTDTVVQKQFEIIYENLAKLKKENAELNGELAQAKGLLTKWVELFSPKDDNIPKTPIQVETEQFINEGKK